MPPIPVIDMTATGQNIFRLRHQAYVTVRIQNVSTPQAIYKWKNGTAMPTIENHVALAAILGVTIDEIIVCRDRFQTVMAAHQISTTK